MARERIVVIVDDLDGTTVDPTKHRPTRFSIDGKAYEIDLSPVNRRKLEDALSPYIENGRRASKDKRATNRVGTGSNTAAIREWAQQNGHEVSARGRISAEITAAYAAAH